MTLIKKLLCLGLLGSFILPTAQADISQREDVQNFIDGLVNKHDFNRDKLNKVFADVTLDPKIIERMKRPYEAKPWFQYQPIFVTQTRIKEGVEFYKENIELLKRAEKKYGVPAEIITAIIGVESRYGRHKGDFRVLDSLSTLGFDYPRRSRFFLKELEEFLLLSHEESFISNEIVGSYAGAMGKPQFISSSYRHYAVDFDGDNVRDLMNSTADAIGSVANYLKRHNWQRGQEIAVRTNSLSNSPAKTGKLRKPKTSIKQWREKGYLTDAKLSDKQSAILISLENKEESEHWLGLQNFYAITRYNHSELYAMAVFQLSEKIRAGMTIVERDRLR